MSGSLFIETQVITAVLHSVKQDVHTRYIYYADLYSKL